MPHRAALNARWLIVAAVVCLSSGPLAAEDRYLRLDDGLYELNADGTYHKVKGSTASSPQPSSSPSRPATTSSSGRFTGQERFMRFDDGLYERMADGTYTKVDERRQVQQSQSGGYGASSTSSDPRWQQQFGQQHYSGSRPPQWSNNGGSQQWNNGRPQQWNNGGSQQWNNNRPPQWSNQNQQAARELGILLNVLGGVIQNGNGTNGGRPPRPNFQPAQPSFQPPRPSFQPPRPSFQPPRPTVQPAQPNFQPPRPSVQSQTVVPPSRPPQQQPQSKPSALDAQLQQGGNKSTFRLQD